MFGLNIPELTKPAPGVNSTKAVNVHSIAIQVPTKQLTRNGSLPTSVTDPAAVLGVWTTASRQRELHVLAVRQSRGEHRPVVQVSRSGNPLINEVLIPLGKKDYWNTQVPSNDRQFASYYATPSWRSSCRSSTRRCPAPGRTTRAARGARRP